MGKGYQNGLLALFCFRYNYSDFFTTAFASIANDVTVQNLDAIRFYLRFKFCDGGKRRCCGRQRSMKWEES